jgi:hypothetical protein
MPALILAYVLCLFWNNNQVLTFWTFAFSTGLTLGNADFLATVFAMKINDRRLARHYHNTVAS